VSNDPKDHEAASPGDMPGDLSEIDRAMLLIISHRQRDTAPLSADQERLLDTWMAGRLSAVDADRAAELAKHNLLAAERVLEHRLIAAANHAPAVPNALSARILRTAQSEKRSRPSRLFNLRWPTLTGWQWSGLSAAAATIAVVVIMYGQWDQNQMSIASRSQIQSNQSFQIAMVSLDDGRLRRTRGSKQSATSPDASSGQIPPGIPAQDLEVPAALLRRAIDSVMTDKSETEYSELMGYLRAKDDRLDGRSVILIDIALADRVPEKTTEQTSIQIRAYNLDSPLAAAIRNKIKIPQTEKHSILLTLRR
jgi:hypothetical protein